MSKTNFILTYPHVIKYVEPQKVVETFTTAGDGSWICPTGVTYIHIECIGGGGAGKSASSPGSAGSGGGGGAYASTYFAGYGYAVTPGKYYNYTVGYGGDTMGPNGSRGGGYTRFRDGYTDIIYAAAGGDYGGQVVNCVGYTRYRGGDGAIGLDYSYSGGAGSPGSSFGYGEDADGVNGHPDGRYYNPDGAYGIDGASYSSTYYGYGGSGAMMSRHWSDGPYYGGNGIGGIITLTYTIPGYWI